MRFNPMTRTVACMAALPLVLLATGCGDDDDSSSDTTTAKAGSAARLSGPTIVIGAQKFPESELLAQIYGQALVANGATVEYKSLGGYRDLVLKAFESKEINFTPEYAASMLEFLNNKAGEASADPKATATKLNERLAAKNLLALGYSKAIDSNAFAVTKQTAEKNSNMTKLSQVPASFKLGAPADCTTNPGCIPGLKSKYGLDLSANFVPLDDNAAATALDGGEIDMAVIFSTDPQITTKDWVVLQDDKGLINADNVIPVLSKELSDSYDDLLVAAVDTVSKSLTTETLVDLRKQVEVDKDDVKEVAKKFLTEKGLLK